MGSAMTSGTMGGPGGMQGMANMSTAGGAGAMGSYNQMNAQPTPNQGSYMQPGMAANPQQRMLQQQQQQQQRLVESYYCSNFMFRVCLIYVVRTQFIILSKICRIYFSQ